MLGSKSIHKNHYSYNLIYIYIYTLSVWDYCFYSPSVKTILGIGKTIRDHVGPCMCALRRGSMLFWPEDYGLEWIWMDSTWVNWMWYGNYSQHVLCYIYNMTYKLYTKHDPTCSVSIFILSPSRTSGFHALVMVCSHAWMLGAIGICIAAGCRLQLYDTSYFGKI